MSPFWKSAYTHKEKRAYHRFLSGLERALILKDEVRFLTLTTAGVPFDNDLRLQLQQGNLDNLNRHFSIFVKRMRRKLGRFEYCKICTNEGNGVVHVLFRGGFIPYQEVSRLWFEIHGAFITDIRSVWGSRRRLAAYLTQYLSRQPKSRLGLSKCWIFEHSSWTWWWLRKKYLPDFKKVLELWHWCLVHPSRVFRRLTLRLDVFEYPRHC